MDGRLRLSGFSSTPAFGYRRLWVLLRSRDGILVNRKTVYRVLKQKQWFRPSTRHHPRPQVQGWVSQASRSNERWAMDGDAYSLQPDGWAHLAAVIDCHDQGSDWVRVRLAESGEGGAERAVEAACLARFGTLRPVGAPVLRVTMV